MATEESRFARWSRMKLEAQEKEARGEAAVAEDAGEATAGKIHEGNEGADDGGVLAAGESGDEGLQTAEMPVPEDLVDLDIESLEPGYDFSRFIKDDVPDMLRRRGLRQLWRSNSVLANLDGMNEYDEDYTDAAVGVAAMKDFFTQTMAKREKLKAATERAEAALGDGAQEGQVALNDERPGEAVAGVVDEAGNADGEGGDGEGDGTSSLRLDGEGLAGADERGEAGVAEERLAAAVPNAERSRDVSADEEEGVDEPDRLTVLASRGWLPM